MKYRPHRETLNESMAEVIELPDRAALLKRLADGLAEWGYELTDDDLRISPYCYDDRIGWGTYIVTIRNKPTKSGRRYFGDDMAPDYFGAFGFTDGPGLSR